LAGLTFVRGCEDRSVIDPHADEVMIGGIRVPAEQLWPEAAGIDDDELARAIAGAVTRSPEYLPVDGWRVLRESVDVISVGSDRDASGSWSTIRFERTLSGLQECGISFWQEPRDTPEVRGRGLSLSFVPEPFVCQRGRSVDITVDLVNTTDETVAIELDGYPFGAVIDLVTGSSMGRSGVVNFAGMGGPSLHLRPGRPVSVNVVLLNVDLAELAVGEYGLAAQIDDVALRATGGRLHVVRQLVPKRW
jgi:hypothetical protein